MPITPVEFHSPLPFPYGTAGVNFVKNGSIFGVWAKQRGDDSNSYSVGPHYIPFARFSLAQTDKIISV